ncbi:MAG: hypothetical protein VB142_03865 [Burkholderia sp.]
MIERLLRERHSPEQIAGILRNMNPDEPALLASHETIYTVLYALPRGQLRAELIALSATGPQAPPALGAGRRPRWQHLEQDQHPRSSS